MDAGQEPAEDGSEVPTQAFPPVTGEEPIEMPRSSMPDHSFLQDALAVADPASEQRGEERTWKIAIGAVVLAVVSTVIVMFVGYVIQLGRPAPSAGAKPIFTEAAGSSRVTAAQPAAPGGSGTAGSRGTDPSPTASVAATTSAAPTTSPPTSPAGSPLRAFSSAGGTIVAGCSGSDAYLATWHAIAGYRVKFVTPGPDVQAAVTFKAQATEIAMTVTCPSGVPVVSTSAKFS